MSALRSLARDVAKNRMKKKGMRRICKGKFFAENWKKYVR